MLGRRTQQAPRHRRHGPHRAGAGQARPGLRPSRSHYHKRRRVPGSPRERASTRPIGESLDQMLARVDIVSVNCPHNAGLYHSALRPAAQAAEARGDRREHRPRRGRIDENALARLIEAGDVSASGHSKCSSRSPAVSPRLVKLAVRGRWCCCRTWARRRMRAASTWARRSSSKSDLHGRPPSAGSHPAKHALRLRGQSASPEGRCAPALAVWNKRSLVSFRK